MAAVRVLPGSAKGRAEGTFGRDRGRQRPWRPRHRLCGHERVRQEARCRKVPGDRGKVARQATRSKKKASSTGLRSIEHGSPWLYRGEEEESGVIEGFIHAASDRQAGTHPLLAPGLRKTRVRRGRGRGKLLCRPRTAERRRRMPGGAEHQKREQRTRRRRPAAPSRGGQAERRRSAERWGGCDQRARPSEHDRHSCRSGKRRSYAAR